MKSQVWRKEFRNHSSSDLVKFFSCGFKTHPGLMQGFFIFRRRLNLVLLIILRKPKDTNNLSVLGGLKMLQNFSHLYLLFHTKILTCASAAYLVCYFLSSMYIHTYVCTKFGNQYQP